MTITKRIDALTALDETRLVEAPPLPTSCKIGLTDRCNFGCAFCAHSRARHETCDMERDLFSGLLKQLYDAGIWQLGLFYLGESFLVPWLAEAIAEAKAIGFRHVFLTTNGSLAAPDFVKTLMAAGLDSLKFSLNYATPEQMADIAKVKGATFNLIDSNVKLVHQIRQQHNFNCELSASYIAYNGEQRRLIDERISRLEPYLDSVYGLPLYTQAGEADASEGWTPTEGNPGRIGTERAPVPCWVLFSQAHISVDGKLSACCFDHTGKFQMADLKTERFTDAWNNETFRALRRAHLAGDVKGTVCDGCVKS